MINKSLGEESYGGRRHGGTQRPRAPRKIDSFLEGGPRLGGTTSYRIGRVVVAVLLLFVVVVPMPAVAGGAEYEAKQTLLRYFDAVRQGDTGTMRSLIGGRLLEERELLLGNPTYAGYLAATFANADFSVGRVEMLGRSGILVEAFIMHGPNDIVVRHYVLKATGGENKDSTRLLIYDENEPYAP